MKKLYLMLSMLFAFGAAANAVPAKKLQKVITLTNGTQVSVELRGDEYLSWWEGTDGTAYRTTAADDTVFEAFDLEAQKPAAAARRARAEQGRVARLARVKNSLKGADDKMRGLGGDHITYKGVKKGLVVLVDFKNKKFADGHDLEYYKNVINGKDFSDEEEGYVGSVRDYFLAQSNGQFELDFDVVGPVTMSKNYGYYGNDGAYQKDEKVYEMIKEACDGIQDKVNLKDYDWDGDGEADQVFFLYAGLGQASGGSAGTVWPHESELRYWPCGVLSYSTGKINTYACANELQPETQGSSRYISAGIGTICHEFSHCLGFADMYDTTGSGGYGMSVFDVMDQGSYNGNGFVPCNYTAFERIYAGWVEAIELESPATVKDMKSVSDYGRPFIMYNYKNTNEYFLMENRQNTGWDKGLYGSNGLLIVHVNYVPSRWANNSVNSSAEKIQCCTVVNADGSRENTQYSLQGDLYPYEVKGVTMNDEFTDESEPAAKLYTKNSDNSYALGIPITNIKRSKGSVSFLVCGGDDKNVIDNTFNGVVDGINGVTVANKAADNRIYSIDGRYLGTDASALGKGIYVVGGKKIVK
ncbi:M6 family metalloprotease domain-containing protein [Leyella stercorea]|jgi:immune inhibitor A|uniref:M6 family metalloprotease domain-containing protein n=1 Tax=Leyella stercorea TaxID=363265 RepID=UPI0024202DC8|nr:M6 family metalloprotease domain-containing protein [Leyella stercorea]